MTDDLLNKGMNLQTHIQNQRDFVTKLEIKILQGVNEVRVGHPCQSFETIQERHVSDGTLLKVSRMILADAKKKLAAMEKDYKNLK